MIKQSLASMQLLSILFNDGQLIRLLTDASVEAPPMVNFIVKFIIEKFYHTKKPNPYES